MNTPAHAIINLLLMGKKHREKHGLVIMAGALIPDAPMLLFYVWEKVHGISERMIWGELYHQPAWQALFNVFHSFPLLMLACFAAWRAKLSLWTMFFASMFCHSLFDFPVHHSDAHQHFFPFSDYRFISPISYWNPDYYGLWVGGMEAFLMLFGSVDVWLSSENIALKRSVVALLSAYLFFALAAIVWWK